MNLKTDPRSTDSYFGGKGLCFRLLINQIPRHDRLIVPFAGHCAITRHMALPPQVILCDKDADVMIWWRDRLARAAPNSASGPAGSKPIFQLVHCCGMATLTSLSLRDRDNDSSCRSFVYVDPPYPVSTRKSGHRYRHEMTAEQHRTLLATITGLHYRVMVSSYWSDLYGKALRRWRHFSFQTQTRGGPATEHVWCNYPEPDVLQDYRWLGRDKRERFKLLRRERNLISKLAKLPALERNALLAAVDSHFGDRVP